jgi:hypothetical protein
MLADFFSRKRAARPPQQSYAYIARCMRKKRQKWLFSQTLTQNKPCFKIFHELTLLHGACPHGAVFLLHGALPLGAVLFSNVAPRARICYVWRHCSRRRVSEPWCPWSWRHGLDMFKWLGHPQPNSFPSPTPTSSSSRLSAPSSVSLSSSSPSSQIPPIRRHFSVDFDLPPFLKVFSMATLFFVQLKS